MAGTRAAGFVLVRQEAGGKRGVASYAFHQTQTTLSVAWGIGVIGVLIRLPQAL